MAAQAGLCLTWSETPEDTFCCVVAQLYWDTLISAYVHSLPMMDQDVAFMSGVRLRFSFSLFPSLVIYRFKLFSGLSEVAPVAGLLEASSSSHSVAHCCSPTQDYKTVSSW